MPCPMCPGKNKCVSASGPVTSTHLFVGEVEPTAYAILVGMKTKICLVPNCGRPAFCKNLCPPHYQRQALGQDLSKPIAPRSSCKGVLCSVEACSNESWARGLCRLHDTRKRRGFDDKHLSLPINFKSRFKTGWVHKGYKWISLPSGLEVMEHRYLMEKFLGRKLLCNETVHHRDENKLNNSLDNLEVILRPVHQALHRRKQLGR